MPIDPAEKLKDLRLSRLREELGYLVEDNDPGSCAWRQGMLDGRMLELKELGIFDEEDVHEFLDELTAALWAKKLAKDREKGT
ncbi:MULTISPECIES: hypothetical protein [Pseudomonas]|uniref:hypothetical protein n=1 Tax=Pseudomonas TaxID=286 RepID=UPI0003570174|nr:MULTISPECIES: hypothetical protein [Pseudomonas]EPJ82404.1 hypothetical protein CFT9_16027 [Pseudomonas sp. CFT9]MBK3450035.1 hypothetical protein [Pseudomonas haemolytica]OKP74660.1 hypothetical protein BTR19_00075 [Pseudomonas fluorescens]